MRRSLILLISGLVLAGSFAAGYRLTQVNRATSPVALDVVDQVREALAGRYYRPVPTNVLQLGSVDAMLSALKDPYTRYLTPPSYRLVRRESSSRFSGIGVAVLPSPSGLVVTGLEPGPAQTAGVAVGDTIVRIGDTSAHGIGVTSALTRITGPPGSKVRIEIVRSGRLFWLTLRRELVRSAIVDGRLLSFEGARWGEIRLSAFRAGSAQVVAREVRVLALQGAQGFVLDLRDNPGGLLTQAVAVSSLFLDRGVVVTLDGAHYDRTVFRAAGRALTRLPLVVLVDHSSASSAEIVAAALGEHARATVVGERTFGKGVVQWLDPLGNGAALMLTVARYYTPLDHDLSRVGVAPQVHAVDDPATGRDEALEAALRVLARPAT
jgi:carboxyl-terminal processing protease